eukprot:PhF_6_TR12307/c1_g1_i1/m.19549
MQPHATPKVARKLDYSNTPSAASHGLGIPKPPQDSNNNVAPSTTNTTSTARRPFQTVASRLFQPTKASTAHSHAASKQRDAIEQKQKNKDKENEGGQQQPAKPIATTAQGGAIKRPREVPTTSAPKVRAVGQSKTATSEVTQAVDVAGDVPPMQQVVDNQPESSDSFQHNTVVFLEAPTFVSEPVVVEAPVFETREAPAVIEAPVFEA